jgi:acyl carrier protein
MTVDRVSDLFRRVLQMAEIEAEADFFALGGDSLLATRVLAGIHRECGVELTFDEFLLAPTPATLARAIASAPR